MKTTAEKIAVMQAYADGKKMEYKGVEGAPYDWEECPDPLWNWVLCDYRIKPEPKYRPFRYSEECYRAIGQHNGWVLDRKADFYLITTISDHHIWLGGKAYCYADFLNDFVWADDGTPCGVLQEE